MTSTRQLSAPRAYYLQEGGAALAFALVFTLQAVYFVRELGLGPVQLVLIGTALELACFVLEIPTGVIADTVSRKVSVVLGFLCLGLSMTLVLLLPSFAGVLAAQLVSALGYTCLSGAQTAWLADEVGEDRLGTLLVRGGQVAALGSALGLLLAGVLGGADVRLPMALGAATMLVLVLTLAVAMPERRFAPAGPGERASWAAMGQTFRAGVAAVRARPVLRGLLVVAALYGALTEAFDRLWQLHLLETFTLPRLWGLTEAAWFALIGFAGQLLGLSVTEVLRRRLNLGDVGRLAPRLAVLTLLSIGAGLAFAVASLFWVALGAFLIFGVVRGLYGPLYQAWLNQGLDSRSRATVLSIAAQADALGQIAGGPAVGALAHLGGVRLPLAVSALLRWPLLWLFWRAGTRLDSETSGTPLAGGKGSV